MSRLGVRGLRARGHGLGGERGYGASGPLDLLPVPGHEGHVEMSGESDIDRVGTTETVGSRDRAGRLGQIVVKFNEMNRGISQDVSHDPFANTGQPGTPSDGTGNLREKQRWNGNNASSLPPTTSPVATRGVVNVVW